MRRISPLFGLVFLLASCRHEPLSAGVSDSTFVRVLAGLRRLPTGTFIDHITRDRMRDSILRANRVTGPQIDSAAVALSHDPDRAAAIWKAIDTYSATPRPNTGAPPNPSGSAPAPGNAVPPRPKDAVTPRPNNVAPRPPGNR